MTHRGRPRNNPEDLTERLTRLVIEADKVAEATALTVINAEKKTDAKPLLPQTTNKKIKRSGEFERAKTFRILELRTKGHSWDEIAELLEYKSGKHVQAAYQRLMDKHETEDVKHLRALQDERLEMAWRGLVPKIEQGRERAVEVGIKVLERQARLHGIDVADQLVEKTTNQPIQINIMPHPGDPRAQELIIENQVAPRSIEAPSDGNL